jgi:hypothetical protein
VESAVNVPKRCKAGLLDPSSPVFAALRKHVLAALAVDDIQAAGQLEKLGIVSARGIPDPGFLLY